MGAMNNPFFNDTRPSKKAVSTKEIDASVEDADGRPSCFDGDQQCGSYYIRNWAILMWSLLAISVASTTIAIIMLAEYASLSAQQSEGTADYFNVTHVPYFPRYDATCTVNEDLSPPEYEQHMHRCSNSDPRILHQVILSRKTSTAEDAQNKLDQSVLNEKAMVELAHDPGFENVHVGEHQVPGLVQRIHVHRGLTTMEQATKAGVVSGVEQGASAVAARTTYSGLQKVEDVIRSRKSTWTQAILHPFHHHMGTENTVISTTHHAWFKFPSGKIVHTVLKETGGGLHTLHSHLAPLVADLHGVLTRALPVAKFALRTFVAGRRLSISERPHLFHWYWGHKHQDYRQSDYQMADDCESTTTVTLSPEKVPSLAVHRNGAASKSTDPDDEDTSLGTKHTKMMGVVAASFHNHLLMSRRPAGAASQKAAIDTHLDAHTGSWWSRIKSTYLVYYTHHQTKQTPCS